jgi:hypothetical protein
MVELNIPTCIGYAELSYLTLLALSKTHNITTGRTVVAGSDTVRLSGYCRHISHSHIPNCLHSEPLWWNGIHI